MKFLVIRFRQMGDAVISTILLNAIKKNFPGSETHFVLNENLTSLFENHPAIDKVIPFSKEERHTPMKYLAKIRKFMLKEKYDVVIDLRSTMSTLPFSLFAFIANRHSRRIGIRKPYTRLLFTDTFADDSTLYQGDQILSYLTPLNPSDIAQDRMTMNVTDAELKEYGEYLRGMGVDTARPILLLGVVAKLAHKAWPADYIVDILQRIMKEFPDLQLIFNYAPGAEEAMARDIYRQLGSPANVKIEVKAPSMRKLMCLARWSTAYFGNEGGARHIVEAVGRPSLSICSPNVPKGRCVRESADTVTVALSDIARPDDYENLDPAARYRLITPEAVWQRLNPFLHTHLSESR